MCDHCGCRAFEPIADLTAEHERILALAWEVAERQDAAARAELLAILEGHVAQEEEGLYPLLVERERLSQHEVAALEDEHRVLDAAIRGPRFDRRAYYALAAHIEDEELELFPAAMLFFDEDDWAAISRTVQAR